MMNRGIAIDLERKRRLAVELSEALTRIDMRLLKIIPQEWIPEGKNKKRSLWVSSPKQQLHVFGEILGMKVPKSRGTGNPSMGKESLEELRKKNPIWENLFALLEERRSVAVFKSHFVDAAIDFDKRMRCSYNPAGTETFRFNSAANAFNRGTNLQNLPTGDEE
jgi:DNA polymerase I-like protein with 3'-5' exonuclease and polymerase domains